LPSTSTLPTPETLAMPNLVAGFVEDPDEFVAVVGVEDPPPPQPARIAAAAATLPATKTLFETPSIEL
jgi:hypothetical protein